MERKRLNEVLILNQSGTWGDEGNENDFPVLRSSNIQDGRLTLDDLVYRKVAKNKIDEFKLEDGDILVTKSSGSSHLIGKCCLFKNPNGKTFLYSNFTQRLRVNKNILLPELLFHYLNSSFAKEYLQKISNTTSGLRNLNMKDYAKQLIPILPMAEQQKIAGILEKADAARQKRKQANQLTEQFLQSAFLEMFGDPVKNEKGWEKKPLKSVLSIKHGFAFKSEFFAASGDYVLLTPGNFFEEGGYRDRGGKQKYYSGTFPKDYLLNKGDLLVAMTEQAPGLLGSPIIIPEEKKFLHNQRLGLVQFDAKWIGRLYLFHLFNFKSVREHIQASATGTKVQHTSPTKIESIVVGVPPLPLQQRFATLVEQVERLRTKQRESERELNNLFQSLMQKYFG